MDTFKLEITPTEYKTTVKSHGWFDLAPFLFGKENLSLELPFKIHHAEGQFRTFIENDNVFCDVIQGDESVVAQVAEKCLSLDVDPSHLQSIAAGDSGFKWLSERGFGRYLRSPTLYEDCIKIVATANMNWPNTKRIVNNLIEKYGPAINGRKTFPAPDILSRVPESELKAETKCGYRARSFTDIAENTLNEPDFFLGDAWKGLETKIFYERLLKIRGMGPASASYLCRIYGKPYTYSIDRWIFERCDKMWDLNFRRTDKNGKEKPDFRRYEKYARERYSDFGEYGPSVFWFEITRYWHDIDDDDGKWY